MTAKPILRVGKIKASGRSTPASVDGHLARSRPTPNADPKRTALNAWLVDPQGSIDGAITRCMAAAGIDRTKLRSDAVLANDVLLTISPEWFRPDAPDVPGTWEPDRLATFQAEAEAFLRKNFGPRLVAAVLHLDEATPHVQAVIVPVMPGREDRKKLRLSSRDMFDPERLSALQQSWEDRLRPHGVGPRTKGSRARHTTLREYYGALEASRTADGRPGIQISDPPTKGLLEGQSAHQERLQAWKTAEAKRLRQELRPLAVAASRGRLYDAERRSNVALRSDLSETGQRLAEAWTDLAAKAQELGDAYVQIGLDEEAIRALRRTPLNDVAAALGWTGPVLPKENAIDLVRRVAGLEYRPAVAWLAQRLGPEVAATAVREAAEPAVAAATTATPVWTPAERVKQRLIREQLAAHAAPHYRVTVMTERGEERIGRNMGRQGDQEAAERLFTAREVEGLVGELTALNARGGHVYVTPIERSTHHVLIDDLSAERLEDLRRRGYAPAVVLESSPGSFQAVLKVPASAGPKAAVNEWFKDVNRDVGDERITGLRHPFRLAGFENRKAKHKQPDGRFPFVRLVEAAGTLCGRASELVRAYAAALPTGAERRPGAPRSGGR